MSYYLASDGGYLYLLVTLGYRFIVHPLRQYFLGTGVFEP